MNKIAALEGEIKKLRQEVAQLRSYVLKPDVDPEGEYRPEFVRKIKQIVKADRNSPKIEFTTAEDFRRRINEARRLHQPIRKSSR